MLSMSYVTCNINVVSLDLVCNKHLLYTICYSLISEEKRHFPSRIISKNRKKKFYFSETKVPGSETVFQGSGEL